MKSICEYLDYKKANKVYKVTNGDEPFDTKWNPNVLERINNWFCREVENTGFLSPDDFKKFKDAWPIALNGNASHVTELVDNLTHKHILDYIKPNQYTYRDIFEILVNYFELNKKNIKIV